jgi:hypothetical protein
MPPRSALFDLTPYGCSGEDRESLANYVRRLCTLHLSTPWTLTYDVIGPAAEELFGVQADRMAKDVGRRDFRTYVSGVSEYAETWAQTLNALTLRTNLEQCTLVPLRGVVSPLKLITGRHRYCPQCFRDDDKNGRGRYERLLWTIDSVVACPLHEIRLITCARATDSERDDLPVGVQATNYESSAARLVANLLDDAHAFPEMQFSDSAQSAFLNYLIGEQFDGHSAALAEHLRLGKSQVHGWRHGIRMSLPRLALVAYCSGCEIADIILGNKIHLTLCPAPIGEPRKIIAPGCTGAKRSSEELKAAVALCVSNEEIRSGAAAAKALQVSVKFLRREFPTEHALFVSRGVEHAITTREEQFEMLKQAYLTAFVALDESGIYPSRQRCVEAMPAEAKRSYSHDDLYRVIRNAHFVTGIPMKRYGLSVN